MTARRQRRRPLWLPLAAYLLLMPTMLWLGFWQLDKWTLQRERAADFEVAANALPVALADVVDADTQRFRRVRVTGRYLADRQMLIDNIVRDGRNGFYVITPLQLDDRRTLLVNRGWIPQTPLREPVGQLGVDAGERTITGRIGRLPAGGLRLGEAGIAGTDWPRILQFPAVDEIAALLERPVLGWTLLADPSAGDTFVRDWRPGGLPAERHLGYAVQWFAMAGALTLLALLVTWRSIIRRRTDSR